MRTKLVTVLVFALAALIPAVVVNPYYLHTGIALMVNIVLALSLNFILGYVGEKSLGHAAFYGIGGYTSAILAINYHLPVWLALLASGVVAGLFGVAIGWPSLRLRGPYFAIATLGFGAILQLVAVNWVSVTKGPMGLPGVPSISLPNPFGPDFVFQTERPYYYLALVFVAVACHITYRLANSKTGRAFVAIHQNADLAESVGVNTFQYKMIAFVLGTVLAGLIGAFNAHYTNFISPKALESYVTLNAVTMVIIGGEGTLLGPIIGAVLVTFLPEVLRVADQYRMVFFGLILLVSIIYAPSGIVGLARNLLTRREAVENGHSA